MVNERILQDSLYGEFAKIGKCLSSPKRIELLDLLVQGPKSVDELAQATSMTVANVSQHLRTLYHSNMVTTKKEGNYVIYSIKDKEILDFLNHFHSLAEKQYMEVQQIKQEFLNSSLGFEGIPLEELDQWLTDDNVTFIDVRPTTEYESNHISGAQSIPLEELEERSVSFSKDQELIVYCRGTYCLLSAKAAEILEKQGLDVYRLEFGVQDWEKYQEQMKK